MNASEFDSKFAGAYQKVATMGKYSLDAAKKMGYCFDNPTNRMPQTVSRLLKREKAGCCFHFAWALLYELKRIGIPATFAVIPEPTDDNPNGQKAVVCYYDLQHHVLKVADIVEDVKLKVKQEQFMDSDCCDWIDNKGQAHNNSKRSIDEMAKYGYLRIYDAIDEHNEDFEQFFMTDNNYRTFLPQK